MVMLDMGDGQSVELTEAAQDIAEQRLTWQLPLAALYGLEGPITDELFSNPLLTSQLKLKRQVGRFYALHWMVMAHEECESGLGGARQDTIDEAHCLIRTLPENGPHLPPLLSKCIASIPSPCT